MYEKSKRQLDIPRALGFLGYIGSHHSTFVEGKALLLPSARGTKPAEALRLEFAPLHSQVGAEVVRQAMR